jgi:4-amino-4-deoxy-L-arabinose transferase-like glycosyltransferase
MLPVGILLRIVVFLFVAPINNDDHGEVVRLLVERGRFPALWDTLQAQHPPLYYLMAAPFLRATGSYKGVQLLSLAFSIATLLVRR